MLSLVICTLDEFDAIGCVLHEVDQQLQGISHEIIVVDDSSDSRTADVVSAYAAAHPQVKLVRRYLATGLSSAAIKGWDVATGRYLAIMDGDGQHDPALMRVLLDKLSNPDMDIAVASRYLDDMRSGLHGLRHRLSRAGTWLTDVMLGVPLADPLSGCFAMKREWYMQVRRELSGLGFKILIDVVASGTRKPRTAQVPTLLRARAGGESKLDTRVVIDLIALLIEKRTRGRFSAGAFMSSMSMLSALLMQWFSLAVLRTLALPLWLALLLSTGVGMTSRFGLAVLMTPRSRRPRNQYRQAKAAVLMTPRSRRPRNLLELRRQWMAYCPSRWTDVPLITGSALALCMAHCPWPIAVLAGVALAEVRYYFGVQAGANA